MHLGVHVFSFFGHISQGFWFGFVHGGMERGVVEEGRLV